jgi:hypothetical protein
VTGFDLLIFSIATVFTFLAISFVASAATEGLSGAVDMTIVLRTSLDNAGALATCPQLPPQQAALIA